MGTGRIQAAWEGTSYTLKLFGFVQVCAAPYCEHHPSLFSVYSPGTDLFATLHGEFSAMGINWSQCQKRDPSAKIQPLNPNFWCLTLQPSASLLCIMGVHVFSRVFRGH